MISCQVSLYPLKTCEPVQPVREAVRIIEGSGLYHRVSDMSTIIKGKREEVMDLLSAIQEEMDLKGVSYTMVITISNICGCEAE